MMKKYVTNHLFNKNLYAHCLHLMGVAAYPVEDGVMFDADQYRANYSAATAPHMVYVNHRWVKALL